MLFGVALVVVVMNVLLRNTASDDDAVLKIIVVLELWIKNKILTKSIYLV